MSQHGIEKDCVAWATAFGLRWQSEAATALSQGKSGCDLFPKRRRAPLAAAVQNFPFRIARLMVPFR
jgi:hypothetical protein